VRSLLVSGAIETNTEYSRGRLTGGLFLFERMRLDAEPSC